MDPAHAVVIGIDIGTTSTKAVAFDPAAKLLCSHSAGYELYEPEPGQAVQHADEIYAAVLECIRETVSGLDGRAVSGLCFSSAMHSLIGLDPHGVPLTAVLTWADSRAEVQVERLRSGAAGPRLHRRTGTPVHPMSPLAKIVWFREREPELAERVGHWVGIKELVLLRMCGALVVDLSVASATGLLDIHRLRWDPEALGIAGLDPEQLSRLVPTATVLPRLTNEAARAVGLPVATPVVVGASDGALASLGLGAVSPGVAACSIGTSGALRVVVDRPAVDALAGLFCFVLTEERWVIGGAINNGGVVLDWAGDTLAPDLGSEPEQSLLDLAARVPAGSGGLVMLPYLLGERAPHWSAVPRGAYVGLTRAHRREHLVRAALEGVCMQLALVLHAMRAAGHEVREIRATGGFARSPLWRQMLADVLGMDIRFPGGHEGSGLGAALLGMKALGLLPSLEAAADLVQIKETVRADPAAAATYAALLPVFSGLYEALVPTFAALRRLSPSLPLEREGTHRRDGGPGGFMMP